MDNFNKEAFIEEVEKRPVIWNTECPEYSDRILKRRAWNELVEIFADRNFSIEKKSIFNIQLQRKWKNLKDTYIKEYKKTRNHPYTGNQKGSSYMYYSKLSFLQPCLQAKPTTSSNDSQSIEVEQAVKATELLASMNDSIVELMETASSLEKSKKSKSLAESQGPISLSFDNMPYPPLISKVTSSNSDFNRRFMENWRKASHRHEDDDKSQSGSTKLEYSDGSPKMRFLSRDSNEFFLAPRKKTSQQHEDDDKSQSSPMRLGLSDGLPNIVPYKNRNLSRHLVEPRKKSSQRHEDDDKLFCLSLYKEIRKVPENNRLAVKIELLNVIHKAQKVPIKESRTHIRHEVMPHWFEQTHLTNPYSHLAGTTISGIPMIGSFKKERRSGQSTSSDPCEMKHLFLSPSQEQDSHIKLDSPVSSLGSSLSSNCSINNNMET